MEVSGSRGFRAEVALWRIASVLLTIPYCYRVAYGGHLDTFQRQMFMVILGEAQAVVS